jgi:hypothetical protein
VLCLQCARKAEAAGHKVELKNRFTFEHKGAPPNFSIVTNNERNCPMSTGVPWLDALDVPDSVLNAKARKLKPLPDIRPDYSQPHGTAPSKEHHTTNSNGPKPLGTPRPDDGYYKQSAFAEAERQREMDQ